MKPLLPDCPGPERKALFPHLLRRLSPKSSFAFNLLALSFAIGVCAVPTVNASRPITLTLAGFGYQAERQLASEGLNDFVHDTGIRVEFIPSWGASADQFALIQDTLKRHFRTPDVFLIDLIWPGTLQHNLLDLSSYLKDETRSQLPVLLKSATIEGRVVSVPLYVNTGLLYYRTDLLNKYGYRHPPGTWSELEKMSRRIQKGERAAGQRAFWGYVWQGRAYEGLTCNALEWQASFGGGSIIEADGTISANNPRAAKAIGMAASWIDSISPPSVLSYMEGDSLNVFRSGNAAFMRYWSSGSHSLRASGSKVAERFGVASLPAGPGRRAQTMGGFQLGVSRYSAYPGEAIELIRYLANEKAQKARALQDGYLPAIADLYKDPEVLKAVPEAQVVERAGQKIWVLRPSSIAAEKYSVVSKDYYEAIHRILSGHCRPEEGLHDLEKELLNLNLNAGSGNR